MAQNITTKQQNFVTNLASAIVDLLTANGELLNLCGSQSESQWNANAYATGDSPAANNITDAVLNATPNALQYISAADLNAAVAGVVAVQATISANIGQLEALRS